jgi:sugar/nucleoside kinase (ribokinase family)
MSILVVGSVAFDAVKTPFGEVTKALGGSATYFSLSASNFSEIRLVGAVGRDFGPEELAVFEGRRIDTSGLVRMDGETFFWRGEYGFDLNDAKTLETRLNVFESFRPSIPAAWRDSKVVFLGNIDPVLQNEVLSQVERPQLVAADTMNFWIQGKREALLETLKKVDLLLINEAEARMLSGEFNLVAAGRAIRAMGPKILVVKRGEYGVLAFNGKSTFAAPGFPLESVFDPTGAGDTFAGGLVGYLASHGSIDDAALRRGIILGQVLASLNVEDFSVRRLRTVTPHDIRTRYAAFRELMNFEELPAV